MLKAYRVELCPNNKQITTLMRYAGTARYIFNWGLTEKISAYKKDKNKITIFDLGKLLTQLKKTELCWLNDVAATIAEHALRDLDTAFKNFFRNCKSKKSDKKGFPKFKQKNKGNNHFTLRGHIYVGNTHIKLPRLGKIKLKEHGYVPVNSKIKNATISEHAERWFVSVPVEESEPNFQGKKDHHSQVGIDLGIKTLAVVSDGQEFHSPKPLKKYTRKLKKLQRKHSRCKGVKNREKARKKLAKCHYRIACIRKDTLHKITTLLTKTKSRIVIEDLNVSGMMKNHCLARAISDLGFYEFRRQLEYKGRLYNCEIIVADKWFPSSKTCPCCGDVYKSLKLSEREWECPNCPAHNSRDLAAAKNLEVYPEKHVHKYSKQNTVSSTEVNA